jgi:hypothetical protein
MNKLLLLLARIGAPVLLLGLALYLLLTYDPLTNRHLNGLICLLPLTFFSIYAWTPAIQSDAVLLTPKNLMLFVFFNKLVMIPVELLLVGNAIPFFDPRHSPLYEEVSIMLASFSCFVIGWWWRQNKYPPLTINLAVKPRPAIWRWSYFVIGIVSLLLIYRSPVAYLSQAILTKSNATEDGSTFRLFANLGSRFLWFSVILFWISHRSAVNGRSSGVIRNILFVFLCLISSLSTNRGNIIYPLLALFSVMIDRLVVRRKLLIVISSIPIIALLFFFDKLRIQKSLNIADIPRLISEFYSGIDYLLLGHQIYFGSIYQLTPLIGMNVLETGNTLFSSLMFPVPLLGKAFRQTSGVILYNSAIFSESNRTDQVIPVAAELYYNFGLPGVMLFHFFIGAGYQWVDSKFKQACVSDRTKAFAWFFIALLFNSLIFLSLSVFVQFILYNALPALLLLL